MSDQSPAPVHSNHSPGMSSLAFAALIFFCTTTVALIWILLQQVTPAPLEQAALDHSSVSGPTGIPLVDQPREASEGPEYRSPRDIAPSRGYLPDEELLIDLYKNAKRSVVHVSTQIAAQSHMRASGSGSGFIWDENGYIITSLHLVTGKVRSVFVTTSDGQHYPAAFVGLHEAYDLAVLFIQAPREVLKPIALGTSSGLQVGQRVLAIGNPFGLDQTLATGIISGLDRSNRARPDSVVTGLIQIDATINPGNSGGPLLDSSGRLIGVNTYIPAASPTSTGVGFAVPVDVINILVPDIIQEGRIPWPVLGAALATDPEVKLIGLDRPGVLVIEVADESPAQAGGLRTCMFRGTRDLAIYDLIVGIDGVEVTCRDDFDSVMLKRRPGDQVVLDIYREDDNVTRVFVTLGSTQPQRLPELR
ncbi:MAG: S1-C subfamily serine protease [Planctomycetota bacterium]|jgi:S1-C subfamily serine protease